MLLAQPLDALHETEGAVDEGWRMGRNGRKDRKRVEGRGKREQGRGMRRGPEGKQKLGKNFQKGV